MAKTKEQKRQAVEQFVADVNASKSVILAGFEGLTVPELEELRSKCRESQVTVAVLKKTLLQKGLEQAGVEQSFSKEELGTGVAAFFGTEDEVSPARVLKDFAKTHEQVVFYGGVLNEDAVLKGLDKAAVTQLADLPSKLELQAKLVGSLNAPVSGFVNVLAGNMRNLVQVLKAIQEKQA